MTKKTIGILTHYQVPNHGAILQMHGLYHVLQSLGWDPYVFTYRKDLSFIPASLAKKYDISLKSVPFYFKYFLTKNPFFSLYQYRKRKQLNAFKQKMYRFRSLYDFKTDAAVIGSDEVFSLEVGVNIMMYGHSVAAEKVFSYAASFGQTGIERIKQYKCEALIASGLKTLNAVCVRDKASAETVQALTGISPKICFDPVLLYGFEKELAQTKYQVPQTPYMIVYSYSDRLNKPEEYLPIKKFASEHGLKVISAGFYHKWADKSILLNPLELLKIMQSAKYVVTDTFHGCVLSALVNTEFAVFVRESNINKITYLLNSLNLDDRKADSFDGFSKVFTNKTDWEKVNNAVKTLRKQGIDYLQGVLNEQK